MQGSFCIPSNCSRSLYERARVVRGASGCITGALDSRLYDKSRVERWGSWSRPLVLLSLEGKKSDFITRQSAEYLLIVGAVEVCESW